MYAINLSIKSLLTPSHLAIGVGCAVVTAAALTALKRHAHNTQPNVGQQVPSIRLPTDSGIAACPEPTSFVASNQQSPTVSVPPENEQLVQQRQVLQEELQTLRRRIENEGRHNELLQQQIETAIARKEGELDELDQRKQQVHQSIQSAKAKLKSAQAQLKYDVPVQTYHEKAMRQLLDHPPDPVVVRCVGGEVEISKAVLQTVPYFGNECRSWLADPVNHPLGKSAYLLASQSGDAGNPPEADKEAQDKSPQSSGSFSGESLPGTSAPQRRDAQDSDEIFDLKNRCSHRVLTLFRDYLYGIAPEQGPTPRELVQLACLASYVGAEQVKRDVMKSLEFPLHLAVELQEYEALKAFAAQATPQELEKKRGSSKQAPKALEIAFHKQDAEAARILLERGAHFPPFCGGLLTEDTAFAKVVRDALIYLQASDGMLFMNRYAWKEVLAANGNSIDIGLPRSILRLIDRLVHHKTIDQPNDLKLLRDCPESAVPILVAALGSHVHRLHIAVQIGHVQLVKNLLEQPCYPNKPDHLGLTPLHYAAASGQVEMVRLLLEKGADLNCRLKKTAEGKLVSERPAHLIAGCLEGTTPLQVAFQGRSLEMIKFLLKVGRIDLKKRHGSHNKYFTAAIVGYQGASGDEKRENMTIIRKLLEYGAVQHPEEVEWAKERGYTELAELLLQYRSEPSHTR